jgi:hypothetical protein
MHVEMGSAMLDQFTWSANPTFDIDGDGHPDILLNDSEMHASAPAGSHFRSWLLSGRDLSPIYRTSEDLVALGSARFEKEGCEGVMVSELTTPKDGPFNGKVLAKAALLQGVSGVPIATPDPEEHQPGRFEDATYPPQLNWMYIELVDPSNSVGPVSERALGAELPELHALLPVQAKLERAFPVLRGLQICGDLDGDGILDWLGMTEDRSRVDVVSGSDLHILRTISTGSRRLATVATGGFELGDVDGDGKSDWLVGVHVSQSDDHETLRTCRLGLISIVSGSDLRVIRTIERESFLAGPGMQCPVVHLPD